MPRIARLVAAGVPHHIIQRGNRRQQTFFSDADYRAYLYLLNAICAPAGVEIWAYCLMPNHVHLIATPATEDGLRAALSQTHQRYSRRINQREGWTGFLWQGRFRSIPMDGRHLLAGARYVELNPVRAGLVRRAQDWPWSSARAHLDGYNTPLINAARLLDLEPHWAEFLAAGTDERELAALRASERTGHPLGSERFIKALEIRSGRVLRPQRPGPKVNSGTLT